MINSCCEFKLQQLVKKSGRNLYEPGKGKDKPGWYLKPRIDRVSRGGR